MLDANEFAPNWTSAPGETIVDLLAEQKWTSGQFAQRIGETPEFVQGLLNGSVEITANTAGVLESALGISSVFWLAREKQYRTDSARATHLAASEINQAWLSSLPLNDMVKFGWIPANRDLARKNQTCLEYFDVPSVPIWENKYREVMQSTAFKTSTTYVSQLGAVVAWLRQGERQAAQIQCSAWDTKSFRLVLPALRALTRKKDPTEFLPALKSKCAECGVALVIVRAPTGCRASGATYFTIGGQAVIQLSFRYLSDDHFWFTFFHEAAHLLLHGQRLFLEVDEMDSTKEEEEANDFSAQTLIPYEYQAELHQLRSDGKMIIRFARKLGIAPGIVVGQLQHIGILARQQQNSLKRRFSWK